MLNLDLRQTKSMSDPSRTSLLKELVLMSHLLLGCPWPNCASITLGPGHVWECLGSWGDLAGDTLCDQGLNSCLIGSVSCTVTLKLLLSSSSQAASVLLGTLNVIT